MKNLLSILILVGCVTFAKAEPDSIDVFHIYYNTKKLKECTAFTKNKIVLNSKQFKPGDKIVIHYFSDTPCSDCDITVFAETEKSNVQSRTKGEQKPMAIEIKDLVKLRPMKGKPIKIYRSENKYPRQFLFEIEILNQ